MADMLAWFQNFYLSLCDGLWEHHHGVDLSTLDNPGWRLKIDLKETPLANIDFQRVKHLSDDDEQDWYECWIEENIWHAACGPRNLGEVLYILRAWVVENWPEGE